MWYRITWTDQYSGFVKPLKIIREIKANMLETKFDEVFWLGVKAELVSME